VKRFAPQAALAVLAAEGVEFLVIGGVGAVLHGSAMLTHDLDIWPKRTPDNLERLARALRTMHARIRVDGVTEPVTFACDAAFFGSIALVNLDI
jgi:hypothetical protein